MLLKQQDRTIPGLREARQVEAMIERLGIQDIKLLFDPEIFMWGVYQVRKKAHTFILPNGHETFDQYLMWWCKDKDSKYRPPSERDVNDVVATVHRAQHWFRQGGDALADKLD